MKVEFSKYHGGGNDFIIIDNRIIAMDILNGERINQLCDRRLGIGADGLILIKSYKDCDFQMVYYNADGKEGSMCGNGARCAVAYMNRIGEINISAHFMAYDGLHDAKLISTETVNVRMADVTDITQNDDHWLIDSGSPHYVTFVKNVAEIDVNKKGRAIRYNKLFNKKGINVNFVQEDNDGIYVRTYERGVEHETLSCGTGVVASALCSKLKQGSAPGLYNLSVNTKGGEFDIQFELIQFNHISNIWLKGPVAFIFEGIVEI